MVSPVCKAWSSKQSRQPLRPRAMRAGLCARPCRRSTCCPVTAPLPSTPHKRRSAMRAPRRACVRAMRRPRARARSRARRRARRARLCRRAAARWGCWRARRAPRSASAARPRSGPSSASRRAWPVRRRPSQGPGAPRHSRHPSDTQHTCSRRQHQGGGMPPASTLNLTCVYRVTTAAPTNTGASARSELQTWQHTAVGAKVRVKGIPYPDM